MRRKIAVVTGTRAEYGILKPLLEKIKGSNSLELNLIVTGMHLLEKYGLTINEIRKDGLKIDAEVQMYVGDESDPAYYGRALGCGIEGFTEALLRVKPDILVVIGDRLEALAATLAASSLRISIAHIHGGDKTDSGHIDESIRHAVTRFAHIHFPATEEHANRLAKMGEEPWRIHRVGALGLDSIVNQQSFSKEELASRLNITPLEPIIACVFHPVHLEKETSGLQMREILEALEELRMQTVIIYPNNDAGSQDIIAEIRKNANLPFVRVFPTLPHLEYISLLKHADVLIGNSSSGIIEAPSIGLPVVNIGSRNVGREHADNVIFVNANKEQIIKGIRKGLYDHSFKEKVKQCKNPYGDGKATNRIIRVLSKIKINRKLLLKKINY